jgi:hypothetical protein
MGAAVARKPPLRLPIQIPSDSSAIGARKRCRKVLRPTSDAIEQFLPGAAGLFCYQPDHAQAVYKLGMVLFFVISVLNAKRV